MWSTTSSLVSTSAQLTCWCYIYVNDILFSENHTFFNQNKINCLFAFLVLAFPLSYSCSKTIATKWGVSLTWANIKRSLKWSCNRNYQQAEETKVWKTQIISKYNYKPNLLKIELTLRNIITIIVIFIHISNISSIATIRIIITTIVWIKLLLS